MIKSTLLGLALTVVLLGSLGRADAALPQDNCKMIFFNGDHGKVNKQAFLWVQGEVVTRFLFLAQIYFKMEVLGNPTPGFTLGADFTNKFRGDCTITTHPELLATGTYRIIFSQAGDCQKYYNGPGSIKNGGPDFNMNGIFTQQEVLDRPGQCAAW